MAATETRRAVTWDYAPAPESRDAASLKQRYDLFIGGKFVAPKDGSHAPSVNPATEETLAEVAFAGPKDVAKRGGGRAGRARRSGPGCRRWSAASTCSGSPA